MNESHKSLMILSGAILFLIGLLSGFFVEMFLNSRMGLSSHLAGIQGALFLLVIGALWQYVSLPRIFTAITAWSIVYGMYGFWIALTLSAIWGTSEATPIAGAGYSASPWQEAMVQAILYSASLACLGGAVLLIEGFRRGLQRQLNQG